MSASSFEIECTVDGAGCRHSPASAGYCLHVMAFTGMSQPCRAGSVEGRGSQGCTCPHWWATESSALASRSGGPFCRGFSQTGTWAPRWRHSHARGTGVSDVCCARAAPSLYPMDHKRLPSLLSRCSPCCVLVSRPYILVCTPHVAILPRRETQQPRRGITTSRDAAVQRAYT